MTNKHFMALMHDLGRHVGLDLQPDEDDAVHLQFEDGLVVRLCESEGDLFAIIADTGVNLSSLSPEVQIEAAKLFLQINFVTPLSSRISIAQSPEQTIVATCSDYATRLTGPQLFDLLEIVIDKTRALKEMIADLNREGPNSALEPSTAHRVGQFA